MVNPIPYIIIDGNEVPIGVDLNRAMVLDKLSISFGRQSILDFPEPARAQLQILFSPNWRWIFASPTSKSLVIGVRYPGVDKVIFRGSIVSSSWKFVKHEKGIPLFRISLIGADALLDLANSALIDNTLRPLETWGERFAWAQSAAGFPALTTGQLVPYLTEYGYKADYSGKSVIDVFREFFVKKISSYRLNPQTQALEFIPEPAMSAESPLFFVPIGSQYHLAPAKSGIGLINGSNTIATGEVEQGLKNSITDVIISYPFGSTAGTDVNRTESKYSLSSSSTRRLLRFDVNLPYAANNAVFTQMLNFYIDRARDQGLACHPPTRTFYKDGLQEVEIAESMTGMERGELVYIEGSIFNVGLHEHPVARVLGSTLTYEKNYWTIDRNYAPVRYRGNWYGVTFASFPRAFNANGLRLNQIHKSVLLDQLRQVKAT